MYPNLRMFYSLFVDWDKNIRSIWIIYFPWIWIKYSWYPDNNKFLFNLIASTIIIICLVLIVFIIARKIPEVKTKEKQLAIFERKKTENSFEKKIFGKSLEDWDIAINRFLEYWLRKLKIIVLKTENYLSKSLLKLKEQKENLTQNASANGSSGILNDSSAGEQEIKKETKEDGITEDDNRSEGGKRKQSFILPTEQDYIAKKRYNLDNEIKKAVKKEAVNIKKSE